MNKQITYGIILLIVFVVAISALVYTFQSETPQSNYVELVNEFESNGFRFAYPEGWRHQIPQTNILFLASPEVLQGEHGATITIQRSLRLSSEAQTLNEALDIYLERGPLRADRSWSVVDEYETITLSGRETVQTRLEGSEQEGTNPMRSEIFVTRADNGVIYIVTTVAPIEQWDEIEATLTAIIQSITILE